MMLMTRKFLLPATALVIGIASVSMPAAAAKVDRGAKHGHAVVNKHVVVVKHDNRRDRGFRNGGIHDNIDVRQARQAKRIQQGIRSGELTPREVAKLREQQDYIRKLERKAERDGKITWAERQRLRAALDAASRSIYKEKHDAQDRDRVGRRYGMDDHGPRRWYKRWFWKN